MAYLLDANVFITAKNNHYGFEFCPAFWDWLDAANATGMVRSIERVYAELIVRDDKLSDWARARRAFFEPLAAADVRAVAMVNRWANDSADFDAAAKAEFAAAADSFLIAQAYAGAHQRFGHTRQLIGRRQTGMLIEQRFQPRQLKHAAILLPAFGHAIGK